MSPLLAAFTFTSGFFTLLFAIASYELKQHERSERKHPPK
jgi:hypothetical protein